MPRIAAAAAECHHHTQASQHENPSPINHGRFPTCRILLKRWRVNTHTFQRLIAKVDAIDLAACAVSAKPVTQTD